MMALLLSTLWLFIHFKSASCVKIGSYNTFQIFTNPFANDLLPKQVPQVGQSDIDVLCLQELNLQANIAGYTAALQQFGYSSFSIMDIDPRSATTPCDTQQIAAITSQCGEFCGQYYDASGAFGYCLASACPPIYDSIMFTECSSCIGLFGGIQPKLGGAYPLSLQGAAAFCGAPPPPFNQFVFKVTDGLVMASKPEFPILNTWSYEVPSWLFTPVRLHIAEIGICSETAPNTADCPHRIIVGCTHLEATAFVEDTGVTQSARLDDTSISSHVGINRVQTEFILDNYYNDNILETLGIEDKADDIYGVFLMGDTNTGQLFNRCDWKNENGERNADNCDGEEPSNPFDLFDEAGFVDAPDLKYKRNVNPNVECTVCKDDEEDDFNILTKGDGSTYIDDPDSSRDLDHILVQDGYCKNFKPIAFEREFMEPVVSGIIDNELVATSDHYGISLEIKFKNVDKAGRRSKGKCREKEKNGKKKKKKSYQNASTFVIEFGQYQTYAVMGFIVFLLILNIICLIRCCNGQKKEAKYSKVDSMEISDEENVNLKN